MKSIKFLATSVAIFVSVCSYSQVSYKINATGQTLCYDVDGKVIDAPKVGDPLYGQDASYLKGVEMSFVDNGDGTITDQNTALTWQQIPPMEGMSWADAKEYCENLELGGYSDWRLPTLKELFSISNFEDGWPYLDTAFFSLSSDRISKDEQYWADNKYVGETVEGRNNAAFGVNHVTGHIKAYPAGGDGGERGGNHPEGEMRQGEQEGQRGQRPPMPEGADSLQRPPMQANREQLQGGQGEQGGQRGQRPPMPGGDQSGKPMGNPMDKQVRAVRGAIYGENNFVDNGDGTISDTATGLMWAKDDNGQGIEWIEALPYAEGATLASYTDWRLPNIKELQSIVDYSRAPSSKGVEAAIDPIFNCTPFVNEADDDDYGYYWSGTSACFTKGRPFYFAWYVAFGRAVNNRGADFHGAGAVRFDSKSDNGVAVEGGEERYYNFVRLVRDIQTK